MTEPLPSIDTRFQLGVAAEWTEQKRERINGIPIFYGQRADGRPFVQRFVCGSKMSTVERSEEPS